MSAGLFDYSSATINGKTFTLPLKLAINTSILSIKNLKNLKYIPKTVSSNSIAAWTIDNDGFKVAESGYNVSELMPIVPARSSSFSFIRSNRSINGIGRVTINYVALFPNMLSYMVIRLPTNQAKIYMNDCTFISPTSSIIPCESVLINDTTMKVIFANQTTTTLLSVKNLEPNSNQLILSMYTANN